MPETDASEVNRSVIERFYNELWNGWSLAVADEIVSENLRFRGSLGSTLEGLEGFKDYVRTVRDAFPDWLQPYRRAHRLGRQGRDPHDLERNAPGHAPRCRAYGKAGGVRGCRHLPSGGRQNRRRMGRRGHGKSSSAQSSSFSQRATRASSLSSAAP
jgi:hypothetical protein